jgi:signal transduction histidine kinase/anti-sigma regulatory factor (Ser/Thr protein kinase)
MAKFKVHARVLDLLGAEQIADMPTAVSELFKNAYDAYADNVSLELFRHKQHAILWDDGTGMSLEDVENRWLVVGTPSKKITPPTVRDGYERRPVMGEKGIGRLAISTLGDTLLLISKKEGQQQDCFTALFLNWKVARNHKLMLDEFEVPVLPFNSLDDFTADIFGLLVDEFKRQLDATFDGGKWVGYEALLAQVRSEIDSFDPDLTLFSRTGAFNGKSGTAFYLGNVTDEAQCLKKPKDRFDTTDQSVYDQIVLLLSNFSRSRIVSSDIPPAPKSIDAFYTDVRIWDENLIAPSSIFEDKALFQPDDLEPYDHFFDVQFDGSGRYSGTIIRYGEKLNLPSPEQQTVTRELKCGPFGFRFWYWQGVEAESMLPSNTWQRIGKKLKYSGGIMVYRDGLRVLPYGLPENDWLSIEERRSKGAGYYFFSYRRMFGYVTIDAANNPTLKDKAGREGIIKNGAYRDLRSTLESFLQQITTLYFRKDEGFRAQQNLIKAENKALEDHKNTLNARRKELLEKLKTSLSQIERQRSRIAALRGEILQKLGAPDLSIEEMEEIVSTFEKRVQQLLGESKVTIPKNLSFGRGRDLNQVAFDYDEAYNALRTEAESSRDAIMTKVVEDCPTIEKRLARRRLLENALASGKMRVGKSFAELNSLVVEQSDAIASRINGIKTAALNKVEDALLQATGTTSIAEAISVERCVEEAVKLTAEAATSGENVCMELHERLSHVFGSALSEDEALIMTVQDDRIEELEKKVQETVELAQIGLSVEMIHHDLHNMFRGISGSIRVLQHMFNRIPEAMGQVNSLQSTFQHLELRYRQLEPLYRASYRTKKQISGKSILDFVKQFLEHDLDVVGVNFEVSDRFLDFNILESPALIHPAFVNLVDNAIYWLRSVDRRTIRFDIVNDVVVVNDSGPGIHETMLERVFEAFTTTKNNGRGLGLYIARQSLSLANHEIWATNDAAYKVEPGACFCLKFSEKARNHGKEDGDVAN